MFSRRPKKRTDLNKKNFIKSKILDNLAECVKVVQLENKNTDIPLTLNESSSRLCTALEALFIHGLKSTFLGRLPLWGAGEFSPRLPEPSFWTFALLYSHKQVINTIESYTQISTEVGKGRAWLRMALNDGLLGSYLTSMVRDRSSVGVHYENYAMLRDTDKMDLVRSYITGLEIFTFNLATNVSMLNRWLPEPLGLAGVWENNLEPLTDTSCVDVAAELEVDIEQDDENNDQMDATQPCLIRSLAQPIQNNSVVQLGLLNEDEALRLILQSTPLSLSSSPAFVPSTITCDDLQPCDPINKRPESRSSSAIASRAESPLISTENLTSEEKKESEDIVEGCETSELSFDRRTPDKDEFEPDTQVKSFSPESEVPELERESLNPFPEIKDAVSVQCSSPCTPSATPSMEWDEFQAKKEDDDEIKSGEASDRHDKKEDSVQSDSTGCSSDQSCACSTQGPDPECKLCLTLEPRTRVQLSDYVEADLDSTDQISLEGERKRRRQLFKIGFRKTPDLSIPELSLQRNLDLVSCLDMIPRELGLHTQEWRCIECTKAIGALFGNGKVCTFTKKHYCEDCHVDHQAVIPPLLLYNWDNKQYPVSKSSYRFIQLARVQPIIKLREFNPKIFDFVSNLDEIMAERKKLHYMHAYLTACKRAKEEELLEKLFSLLKNREYLCTLTDTFSILDVEDIHCGEMRTMLRSGLETCRRHINSCIVCSGRGFICEVCQDKQPVYPYNLEDTSQCGDCFTVFHSDCAKSLVQCPRCERISSRALNSLITETKLSRELRDNL